MTELSGVPDQFSQPENFPDLKNSTAANIRLKVVRQILDQVGGDPLTDSLTPMEIANIH